MRNNFSKIAFTVGLIACLSITAFAQNEQELQQEQGQQGQSPPQNSADQKVKVQRLIKAGVKKNKEEIQKESFYLSLSDKESLYNKNRKRGAGGWAALDFFVGFGSGSYIQGDVAFGATQSAMDLLGWGLIFTGIATLGGKYAEDEYACQYYGEECNDDEAPSETMIGSGIAILAVSRICSWIFPFTYQKKYNRALDAALNGNKVSYSIDPLLIPKEGMPATGLAFNLRF